MFYGISALEQLSNMLLKLDTMYNKGQDNSSRSKHSNGNSQLEGFSEELPITKEISVNNSVSVSVRKCSETAKNILCLETDLPKNVVLHWGVCRDEARKWEVPPAPHPPETVIFKGRALRTPLQVQSSQVKPYFYALELHVN